MILRILINAGGTLENKMKRVIRLGKRKPKKAFSQEEITQLVTTINTTLGGMRDLGKFVAQYGSDEDLKNLQEARQILTKIPHWIQE